MKQPANIKEALALLGSVIDPSEFEKEFKERFKENTCIFGNFFNNLSISESEKERLTKELIVDNVLDDLINIFILWDETTRAYKKWSKIDLKPNNTFDFKGWLQVIQKYKEGEK